MTEKERGDDSIYILVPESILKVGKETWITAAALVKIPFPHWKVSHPISDRYLFTVSMCGLINVYGGKVKKSVERDLESENAFLLSATYGFKHLRKNLNSKSSISSVKWLYSSVWIYSDAYLKASFRWE